MPGSDAKSTQADRSELRQSTHCSHAASMTSSSMLRPLFRHLPLLSLALALPSCTSSGLTVGEATAPRPQATRGLPQIINVSAYDPKEKQRDGRSYSASD